MITPRFIKIFPVLSSLMLTSAMFVQMRAWEVTDDPTAFHETIRSAVSAIPTRFNDWEGTTIDVPNPAAKLLRPNVLFARRYENEKNGRAATVVFIHCTDSRDMSGHYPPNCYPASGWTSDGASFTVDITLETRAIPMEVYKFTRTELGTPRRSVIYNFFILPSGLVTRMADIQTAAGDRTSRPYGAAQVQVAMDASTESAQQVRIVQELLQPFGRIIDTLQVHKKGNSS